VDIPNLEVPKCAKCGEQFFNYTTDEQILAAVRAKGGASPVAPLANSERV
jgi:hypothetical protein